MTDYQAYIVSAASFVSLIIVYTAIKLPSAKDKYQVGLLLFAFVRDLNKLLLFLLRNDWYDLPLTQKLDRLKAIYDLILNFDSIKVEKQNVDPITKTLNELEISYES